MWSQTPGPGGGRVLPDGCMDLIWMDGRLVIAGPNTYAFVAGGPVEIGTTGLRFAPGAGPAVFGVPASELIDQLVPLDALWPEAAVRRMAQRVGESPARGGVLEALAAGRLRESAPDPVCLAVAADLRRGRSVAAAAQEIGISDRQLHRRSLAAFGYGPKMLARVLRLQQAVGLARRGVPSATVAAMAGYSDQPHFAREVRALAGVPLGVLLGE
ncbi:MAG TPA: helix-turn-helix domain-containing protein [Actinocrinis sp.]|nr:helix-turn-helix domain-containing protein [Actinocrinis sp.]